MLTGKNQVGTRGKRRKGEGDERIGEVRNEERRGKVDEDSNDQHKHSWQAWHEPGWYQRWEREVRNREEGKKKKKTRKGAHDGVAGQNGGVNRRAEKRCETSDDCLSL